MSCILVTKPTDHKVLFEWVDELTGLGGAKRLETKDSNLSSTGLREWKKRGIRRV
ncbi:MAG: hypothetical protein ABIJ59_05240 [Pseudomonadota bacterium]